MNIVIGVIGAIAGLVAVPPAILAIREYYRKRRQSEGAELVRRKRWAESVRGRGPFLPDLSPHAQPPIAEAQRARIARIVGGVDDFHEQLSLWQTYLRRTLLVPFEASVEQTGGHDLAGPTVLVRRLLGRVASDDILVQIMLDDTVAELGLSTLIPTDRAAPQFQPVNDYRVWRRSRGT